MVYLFNLKMCFTNSLPNHDFTRSPNSSEFFVSIHLCWLPFQELKLRIEHMNLTALRQSVGK